MSKSKTPNFMKCKFAKIVELPNGAQVLVTCEENSNGDDGLQYTAMHPTGNMMQLHAAFKEDRVVTPDIFEAEILSKVDEAACQGAYDSMRKAFDKLLEWKD